MGIARNQGQNFILRYKLNNGAFFGTTLGVPVYSGAVGTVSVVLRSGGPSTASTNSDTVEYDVNVLAAAGTLVGDKFTLSGTVRFPLNAGVGSTTALTVDVRDVISPIDTIGTYTQTLATLAGSARVTAAAGNLATIDATAPIPLTQFVAQSGTTADDTTQIAKVAITTSASTALVYDAAGTPGATIYSLAAADQVLFTITGDFTGVSQVGFDFGNGGTINAGLATATDSNEKFTIAANGQSATLQVNGDRLLNNLSSTIWFTKTAAAQLNPRSFNIEAKVTPVCAAQQRSLVQTGNYFQWQQNGTTLLAPYVSFTPGNGVKFRFTNSTANDIIVLVTVATDQANAANALINNFTIPGNGSRQITFSDAASTGTGEIGPIASLNSSATLVQPVRAKVTFYALSASANVSGVQIVYSPVGVVTLVNMPQQGLNGWEK